MKKIHVISLSILGISLIIAGFFVGKKIMSQIVSKVKDKVCVHSGSNLNSWKGDASIRNKHFQIKIYYWNITNVDNFLYYGETPQLAEVGPYIYIFGTQKENIQFDDIKKTVKYQTILQTEYDDKATRKACPTCNKNDKLSILNVAYIGLMAKVNGDTNFFLGTVPATILNVINILKSGYGSRDNVLAAMGNSSLYVSTSNIPIFPSNWELGFSTWLKQVNSTTDHLLYQKVLKSTFSLKEMNALFTVISNATTLGVVGVPPTQCYANPTTYVCLNQGFIFLLKVMLARQKQNIVNDTVALKVYQKLEKIFCSNSMNQCLAINMNILLSILYYVTTHLTKLSVHLLIDSNNYGLVTTRTQNELSLGYTMNKLKLPGFQNGVPVPGLMHNDSDIERVKLSAKFNEYWTCDTTSGYVPFTLAAYNNNEQIPQKYFPHAGNEELKITGKYPTSYFGYNSKLKFCKSIQASTRDSYEVFSSNLKATYTIVKKSASTIGDAKVHNFEMNIPLLLDVNNKTVFYKGLIGLSQTTNGVPLLTSAPHFLNGENILSTRFKMIPNKEKHSTWHKIEPVTGNALSGSFKYQINLVILEHFISSPRARSYNITYKEKASVKFYTKPFPVTWYDVSATASDEQLKYFARLNNAMTGSCVSVILGPVFGIITIALAAYLFFKSIKSNSVAPTDHKD